MNDKQYKYKILIQIIIYLIEVVVVAIVLAYLSTFIQNTNSTYDFIERCIMGYTLYQIIVIIILTNINDIQKDSLLAYNSILKICLLYIETGDEGIKNIILKHIDNQLEESTFNNEDTRISYKNIKGNIDCLNKNYIQMELISAEHLYEASSLNFKHSFLLRIFK